MRKIVIGLAVIVALVVLALAVAPRFINVNQYRPQLEAKLKDRLGRDISLGPMRLSLLPLAFRVENAVIGEDPQFKTGRTFAEARTFLVRPALLPLLHHDVQINRLQLDKPVVEIVRNEHGVWNFASLIKDKQQTEKPQDFSLDYLKIYDGQVAVTDRQENKPRAVYDHIDLVVSDFAPDKPFSVDLRAHLPGTGAELAALQGKIGPIQHDALAQTPFDGHFNLDSVSLAGLQQFLKTDALAGSDAVLSGNADLKNNAGALASKGKLVIAKPRIRGVDIGYPISIDYEVDGDLNRSTAEIHKADLKLGQTPVSFHGSINGQPTPAQVDMTVQASNASIAEAAKLAAAFGAAFNAKTNVTGTVNLNVHAQGSVIKLALNGTASARNLRISGGELPEPVQVETIDLALSPDNIRSNEFAATTGKTKAAAQFTLSGYTTDNPKIEAKLNTNNADIQEFLRIAHACGISAVDGVNGSGVITLNVDVSGPIRQSQQLTFTGSGAIRNASLQLPSLAKPVALRQADLQFNGNGVSLSGVDVSVGQTTAHGNLAATNFAAPRVQFTMSANHVNVGELEQLFKTGRPQPAAAQAKAAAVQPNEEKHDGSVLDRTTGTGSLAVDEIVYDELTLKNVHSNVNLDHGIITLAPLTAGLYNGQQTGTIVINTRTTPATYTVDSRLQSVDANQLLSSISPVKQTLYGLLSANADTHFTTAAGARSILPSLNGKVSFNLKDGKIANVDLLHQLATIGQFQQTSRALEPFTHLVQLTGDFNIQNGVAHTNNLKAVMDVGSLAADGIVDLARESLDLRLTAVLSQQYSQSVGGTGIAGFLNTALANNHGELVIPVMVSGTFQDPHFAPDMEKVAQMKLQNLLPGVDNPGSPVNGILGDILRAKPGGPRGAQPATPSNPLQNLFDVFGNGGQQQKRRP